MNSTPLPRFRSPLLGYLRALAFGLSIGFATVASADNLPEVQRLIKQGQFPQALEKVDSYLTSKPKDAQGRFLKGLILTEMNRPADAIGVFSKLSEDYPELPEPYNNLAVLYAQQKQYDKARSALEMAIRTHPSYAIAYENLGDVYAKLASQAYDKALQLDNSNTIAQNKLALIRELVSTSGTGNVKPTPVAAKPSPAPTATVTSTTPSAAAPTAVATAPVPPPAQVSSAPVPSKPAPAAAAKSDANEEVIKAVAAWADAWSRKDTKAYFAAYGSNFTPPKGQSRKAWEQDREARITGKPGKISVTFDTPQVSINGDKATAKFRQYYVGGSLNTSATKTLVFVRTNNRWLIAEEIAH